LAVYIRRCKQSL